MELKLFSAYAALVNVAVDLLCAQAAYESAEAELAYLRPLSDAAQAANNTAENSSLERHAAAARLPIVIDELSELLRGYPSPRRVRNCQYYVQTDKVKRLCRGDRVDAAYRELVEEVRALLQATSLLINTCESGVEQRVDVTV